MKRVEAFFSELDDKWSDDGKERIKLPIIGSTALFLRTNYDRGTKDSDVLETDQLKEGVGGKILALAGKGTDLYKRHHLYLDIVSSALPFLPSRPIFHSLPFSRRLKHFDIQALDAADVVVSKLKRFNANDAADIRAMVEYGEVKHRALMDRFRSAVDSYSMDARAEDLPKYIANLHAVERDFFRIPETSISLPEWMEDR